LIYHNEALNRGSQTSRDHIHSVRSSVKDYTLHSEGTSNKNITNDIKDLLDKLVTYQQPVAEANKSVSSLSNNSHSSNRHSSSLGAESNQVYTSKPNNHLISTDSLVELRSSDSSSVYIMGGDIKMKASDFRPHATAKEMIFRSEKPSLIEN
jgi:hypothetical protein